MGNTKHTPGPHRIVRQIEGALFQDARGDWWTTKSGDTHPTVRVDTAGRYFRFYAERAGLLPPEVF